MCFSSRKVAELGFVESLLACNLFASQLYRLVFKSSGQSELDCHCKRVSKALFVKWRRDIAQ